jgi:MFS transporter, DHA1 family, inner membrane transport protein
MSALEGLTRPLIRDRRRPRVTVSPALVLFMCVFTSQAAVLVLSPILVDVARDLDVSTAVAGQLRVFAAPVALLAAVLVARWAGQIPLRTLLSAGEALVSVGSVASAAAPSFVVLALAQVPLWIGVAVLGVRRRRGGHAAVGVAFGALFLGATIPYLSAWAAHCPRPGALTSLARLSGV